MSSPNGSLPPNARVLDVRVRMYVGLAAFIATAGAALTCYLLGAEEGALFFGGQSSALLVVILDALRARSA